jgi:hypothetical protein
MRVKFDLNLTGITHMDLLATNCKGDIGVMLTIVAC